MDGGMGRTDELEYLIPWPLCIEWLIQLPKYRNAYIVNDERLLILMSRLRRLTKPGSCGMHLKFEV